MKPGSSWVVDDKALLPVQEANPGRTIAAPPSDNDFLIKSLLETFIAFLFLVV